MTKKPEATSVPPSGDLLWASGRDALQVVCHRPHLRKAVTIALVVGTVLFAINEFDVVLRSEGDVTVWAKTLVTYLVPFCVANIGILVAARDAHETHARPQVLDAARCAERTAARNP